MFSASSVFPAPAPGATITGITPHTWVADSNGLYQTTTDLAAEWKGYYQTMLNGGVKSLTPIERLEGNAEAVFENTGLQSQPAADQVRYREDTQREFDAMAAALSLNQTNLGTDPSAPLTEHSYIWLGKTLQDDPNLYELGLQGHGLNNPPALRYNGYTNDFQNNVDNTTLFVGGGVDNNQKAIATFFDDVIISHTPFPVVVKNGQLVQLNQNADRENSLLNATVGLDDFMYGRVLTSADFSSTASCAHHSGLVSYRKLVEASQIDLSAGPSNGQIDSLLGFVNTTIAARDLSGGLTLHAWTADASGQFFTTADLAAEWKGYYQQMLSGHAASLTPIERLEANAEAVFENTKLAQFDPAYLALYRQDAQRQFDAIDAAMQLNQTKYGTDPNAPLTEQTYLDLERTLQSNATLWELAVQGHGLNDAPAPRYRGYTNDFQNNADSTTRYVGGGLNNGRNALTDFFDDNIMTHTSFPTVWRNGKLVQLNQNANRENTLTQAVNALDESMYYRVYVSFDFKRK